MLATLIPLFNSQMDVKAYSLFTQKENKLLNPLQMGTAAFDGAVHINGLDIIENIGLDNLLGDRDVFLELTQFSIFGEIEKECNAPFNRIVFLINTNIKPTEDYLKRIRELKSHGFRFAIKKIGPDKFAEYNPILKLCDYLLLDHRKVNVKTAKSVFEKAYPNIKLVAVNVNTKEEYDYLTKIGSFDLYEGEFFRMPVKDAGEELVPMKVTYIELLNVVNNPDFDLSEAADIIGHDTALVIRLLEMANRRAINSEITSIRHAAAMIGQRDLKKWINSAITKELCVDRPSEINRISLIRAKFAENLAPSFELASQDQELFLMGLFSVMDIILDKPMEEALTLVKVSKQIQDALISGSGPLAHVLNFITEYENASWQEVSRLIIMEDLDMDTVYRAYVDALAWFKSLFE